MRRLRFVRCVVLGIAAAFCATLWGACLESAALSAGQQMACCKDGELSCAPHGSSTDCCARQASRSQDAVAAAKLDPAHSWALVVDSPVLAVAPPQPRVARTQTTAPAPLLRHGPPPYIAYSSLLI